MCHKSCKLLSLGDLVVGCRLPISLAEGINIVQWCTVILDLCTIRERKAGTFMGDMEGTMVIRAWAESDDIAPFRARLISSQPGTGAETVEVAAGSVAVLQAVQLWLDSLESP